MNTIEKLEQLARVRDYLATYEQRKADTKALLDAEKQRLIDTVLTPEIRAKVEEINAEFQTKYAALDDDEKYTQAKADDETLTAEIKAEVVSNGATIKGSVLQAVYAKGRVSYDPKSLDAFALAHPEVLAWRKEGEPSVSIRTVR